MDYRKSDAPVNTQTRNILDFCKGTDNIIEPYYKGLNVQAK